MFARVIVDSTGLVEFTKDKKDETDLEFPDEYIVKDEDGDRVVHYTILNIYSDALDELDMCLDPIIHVHKSANDAVNFIASNMSSLIINAIMMIETYCKKNKIPITRGQILDCLDMQHDCVPFNVRFSEMDLDNIDE